MTPILPKASNPLKTSNPDMKQFKTTLTLEQLCLLGFGTLQGKGQTSFCKVAEPAEADLDTIIFLEQDKLLETAKNSKAGLIITTGSFAADLADRQLLIVDKPYFTLMLLITHWQKLDKQNSIFRIHPSAVVAEDVRYEGEVHIEAGVTIGQGCVLGKGVFIGSGCSIADNVSIGAGTRLYPNVSIYADCSLGKNCLVHSGVVIGADGFGFMLMQGVQQKIPQVGNVIIGDNVEIGANSCIDRATLGSTRIGDGSKLDNLVQVGHNCQIGKHCILCSQVGLAGSTILGDYVYLAGQVGVAGHCTIGDRAMVGAQSGVSGDIPADGRYFGFPAMDANLTKRIMAAQKHLPEIYRGFLKQEKKES